MVEYNKRLVEVSVILNHLKKSDYNKIPKEIIEHILFPLAEFKEKEQIEKASKAKEIDEQLKILFEMLIVVR